MVEISTTVKDTEMNVCFTKYHTDTQKNGFYLSHNKNGQMVNLGCTSSIVLACRKHYSPVWYILTIIIALSL